ncbi:hypothetical protein PROFUN_04470 [Planoprotostelium fungivorum]|uniref:Alpha N-terminal protein methyltransferase 1 n=1 Tax=Planoprotostelium fungivorum TaxID=1890364 RepID=A0A2P6NVQ5_9EUKA|nr:hypothetical protein PROFUN_04470 [Planoprotostelium fungivorum]
MRNLLSLQLKFEIFLWFDHQKLCIAADPFRMEKTFDEKGADSEGKKYKGLQELWQTEDKPEWYSKAVDATVDGMLGGFAHITTEDVKGSKMFLSEFISGKNGKKMNTTRALDCGAGIGRVTKNLLLPLFDRVDLLEQNEAFVEKAREMLKDEKMGNFFAKGMQDFDFTENRYDLIWIQWVAGHLSDKDFVEFFRRCQKALLPDGIIVLKENTTRKDGFIVDKTDSSITRSDSHLRQLFTETGLKVLQVKVQPNFPKELFPVRMYALQ